MSLVSVRSLEMEVVQIESRKQRSKRLSKIISKNEARIARKKRKSSPNDREDISESSEAFDLDRMLFKMRSKLNKDCGVVTNETVAREESVPEYLQKKAFEDLLNNFSLMKSEYEIKLTNIDEEQNYLLQEMKLKDEELNEKNNELFRKDKELKRLQHETLEGKVSNQMKQLDMEKKASQLEMLLMEKRSKYNVLKENASSLETKLAKVMKKLPDRKLSKTKLLDFKNQIQHLQDAQLSSAKRAKLMDSEVSSLKERNSFLEGEVLEKQLETQKTIEKSESDISQHKLLFERKLKNIQQAVELMKKEKKLSELKTAKIQDLEKENNTKEMDLISKSIESAKKEEELSILKVTCKTLEVCKEDLLMQLANTEELKKGMEYNIKELNDKLAKSIAEDIILEKEKLINTLETEINTAKEQSKFKQAEFESKLKAKSKEMEIMLVKNLKSSEKEQSETKSLNKRIDSLSTQCETLKDKNESLAKQLKSNEEHLKEAEESKYALKEENYSMAKQINIDENSLKAANESKHILETKNAEIEKLLKDKECDLTKLEVEYETFKKESEVLLKTSETKLKEKTIEVESIITEDLVVIEKDRLEIADLKIRLEMALSTVEQEQEKATKAAVENQQKLLEKVQQLEKWRGKYDLVKPRLVEMAKQKVELETTIKSVENNNISLNSRLIECIEKGEQDKKEWLDKKDLLENDVKQKESLHKTAEKNMVVLKEQKEAEQKHNDELARQIYFQNKEIDLLKKSINKEMEMQKKGGQICFDTCICVQPRERNKISKQFAGTQNQGEMSRSIIKDIVNIEDDVEIEEIEHVDSSVPEDFQMNKENKDIEEINLFEDTHVEQIQIVDIEDGDGVIQLSD